MTGLLGILAVLFSSTFPATAVQVQPTSQNRIKPNSPYTSCQETFTKEKFTINFPAKRNPVHFECRYFVHSASNDVCRLRVNFKQFTLSSSAGCKDEFLRVGSRKFCGSILGLQVLQFPENFTTIHYKGNGEHPLQIEVEQVRCKQHTQKTCEVTTTGEKTIISSPNYPSPFTTPITCQYTLTPHQNTCQILVTFHEFQLPDSPNCRESRLRINNQSYCGTKTGWKIITNSSHQFQLEVSGGKGEIRGFFLVSVEQIPCEKLATPFAGNVSANQLELAPGFQQCCNTHFQRDHFLLTSPGFLETGHFPEYSCLYQIISASPTICRLRLKFLHFWLGQEDVYYGCTDSFIEVDGRRICGCKDGFEFRTFFENGRKDIFLKIRGAENRGFVIEVTQEECGLQGRGIPNVEVESDPDNEVEVFSTNSTVEKVRSRFLVPNDESRCFEWGLPEWVGRVKEILKSATTCALNNLHHPPDFHPPGGSICQPLPSFPQQPIFPPTHPSPNYPPVALPQPPISPPHRIPPISPPWPQPPIAPPTPIHPILPPHRPIPQPPIHPPGPLPPPSYPPSRCQVFSSLQGGFQSPNYPFSYPNNLKCCYRIRQAPGFCQVRFIILDFDIVWSPKCWNDYLLLDEKYRYCDRSLHSTTSNIPFRNGLAHIDFVTDGFFTGRGFRAVFSQVPCYTGIGRSDQTTPYPTTNDNFQLNVTPVR